MRGSFFFIIAISSLSLITVVTHYCFNPPRDSVVWERESLVSCKPRSSLGETTVGSNAYNASSVEVRERKLHKLYWTSVHGRNEAEAYHFISAYLDDRRAAKGRPAIVVVGYFSRTAKSTPLYCLFKYSSGKTTCLTRVATQDKANCDSIVDKKKSQPMLYLCHLTTSTFGRLSVELPVAVMISNTSNCAHTSGEIPVGNLDHALREKSPPKKKFGVFIGGPLIQKENVIQDLTRFIQMSQLLGAEFFTMYISPEQMDKQVINFLLDTYPEVVRVIEWKKFEIHYPLHYYGQLVLITDCLYRSMHEVDYLVMMDLDEMILPVKHNNWAEMVEELEKKGRYASFMFLNRFFTATPRNTAGSITSGLTETSLYDPSVDPKLVQSFKGDLPAYFTRTNEVKCYFNYGAKTKLIINPLHLVRVTVHESCESVRSYKPAFHVPPEIGISAHYRENSIQECTSLPTIENTIAIKFAKKYSELYYHDSRLHIAN